MGLASGCPGSWHIWIGQTSGVPVLQQQPITMSCRDALRNHFIHAFWLILRTATNPNAATVMAQQADNEPSENDDLSYQACYVFQPSDDSDHDIDDRPRKKRKAARSRKPIVEQPPPTLAWPRLCAGAEEDSTAQLRKEFYTAHWASVQDKIAGVTGEVDEPSIEKIRAYVQTDSDSSQELRTAIVVSGSDKSAFVQCVDLLLDADEQGLVVQLNASQAPSLQAGLKALIRNAIEFHEGPKGYDSFITKHKRQVPMNFDLELLQKYVEDQNIPRILVALSDAETFDLHVLSELIANLASWRGRLPFVLVLGLATTVQLFESRLSKATLRLLDAEVFSLSSHRDVFFDIFAAAQDDTLRKYGEEERPELWPLLGPSVVSSLGALAEEQSTTTSTFTSAIHYAYMTHFYSNSLSALLNPVAIDTSADPAICEAIRNAPSFQSHCSEILDGKVPDVDESTVREILSSDDELITYSKRQLGETAAAAAEITSSLIALTRIASHLSPEISALKTYHDLLTSHSRNEIQDSDAYNLICTSLPSLSATSLTALLPKISAVIPSTDIQTPEGLLKSIQNHTSSLLTAEPNPFLNEALIINARGPLSSAFNPKPRFATERALSSPADYLGCECCVNRQLPGTGKEPAAILYGLLGDAGREVNVMDLWTTFRDRVTSDGKNDSATGPHATPSSSKRKPKMPATAASSAKKAAAKKAADAAAGEETPAAAEGLADSETTERHALALFHRALAELRYLGLVRSANDRRLNKGVEVISRTTWHGL